MKLKMLKMLQLLRVEEIASLYSGVPLLFKVAREMKEVHGPSPAELLRLETKKGTLIEDTRS